MDKRTVFLLILSAVVALAFILSVNLMGSNTVDIENKAEAPAAPVAVVPTPAPAAARSPLNGLACANPKQRPFAVMLGGDPEMRSLSGLGTADIVIEMPVVTSSITRYMAVFACDSPKEIGGVRSARHDFIPLAMGFDAILAHWGGSHFALDKLDAGVMDNINALYLDGTVFYRQLGKAAPFNGFTSFERLQKYAESKGYHRENNFSGYKFLDKEQPAVAKGRLTIGYPGKFKVEYEYDPSTNSYVRFKGGTRELDKNTDAQVAAKNVVVMYAASRQLEGQYNDIDVEGTGKAIIYENGQELQGNWSKDKNSPSSKLVFSDLNGQELAFVPGQIWIQVVQPEQKVDWTTGY